jgi:NhaA family Na+:H+ antiporter
MSTQSTALSPPNPVVASLVLLAATLAALIAANSPLYGLYKDLLDIPIELKLGALSLADPVKNWVKNLLMAIFFLGVALEIKAEFVEGTLSDRRSAALPIIAAVGGMAVPALAFLLAVGFDPLLARGWAIPSATDIAFALGVLGLLGRAVPGPLKAFLLAVAVIDDLGAIAIIAVVYTEQLFLLPLAVAAGIIAVMAVVNLAGVARLWVYLVLGGLLWLALTLSGVSPTLAGVGAAAFVPMKREGRGSPLHQLEYALKAPIAFFIMPVFAFANAGVSLAGIGFGALSQPVTMGIILGLSVGKPVGITLATWLAVQSGLGRLYTGATLLQVIGAGWIAGIGFTMSLFVGALAYPEEMQDMVRLGVLAGSLTSAILGAALLALAARGSRRDGAGPRAEPVSAGASDREPLR